jgi:AraC-like DNA-binding protein
MNEADLPANFSQVLFSCDKLRIGRFHAPCVHPQFNNGGKIRLPTLVFPRSSVIIEPEYQAPFLSNVNQVNFYDGIGDYRRKSVAGNDDICDWFEFDSSLFDEAQQSHQGDAAEFRLKPGAISIAYANILNERLLFSSLQNKPLSPLGVEECALALLRQIFFTPRRESTVTHKRTAQKHKSMSQALCLLLEEQLTDNPQLAELAAQLNTSRYHLCRIFREHTGMSIHQYRTQLRLKHALGLLPEIKNITEVALTLGFASHSHFSAVFYKTYALSPKAYLKRMNI